MIWTTISRGIRSELNHSKFLILLNLSYECVQLSSSMRIHLVLLPFFIPFCLISLSFNTYVATSRCLVHQQFLLLDLKDNLAFNPAKSKKLIHWNQSGDCCQWNGVACNNGRVIGLDLSEESISGGLDNSSLFDLQYLQNLNLAYNDFGSLIPSKFVKLKNLVYLNLSNAGFDGQIPTEVSQLTKLVVLDLSTPFTSSYTLKLEKPNVRMLVENLTQITELYLDGVRVSAVGKEWCHALSSLQKLQVLSMSSCNLSGPIESRLARLQSLSVIRLNQNNISSPVPESFGSFSNLTILELSGCMLSNVFPKGIFQIQTLKVLDISNNQDLLGSLPNFQQDGSLHTLNLSNTNVFGQLPGDISNLKQLSTVDLSHCQFNGTLPISLSKLTKLVHLDLSYNNFTGLIPTFNMSRNLRYLSLFQNALSGSLPSAYFDSLVNLLHIDFGNNFLDGKVPSSLFTLPSLQEVTLSNNGFDGLLGEFPNASSSILQFIDLSSNNLEGPIPISLFQFRRLRFLQLSSNNFNGTIHLHIIWRLQDLHTLGLSHNKLLIDTTIDDDQGLSSFPTMRYLLLASCQLKEFPGFLRNQSQLIALDLSSNQIEGIIPNWVWRFESLLYLNLSNNFLKGMEGPFPIRSSILFVIDLHSNQLRGSIPIVSKFATNLDYSNNKFSFVPPAIDNYMPFLYFLSLSNNSFYGEIHKSFCNFSFLRKLDLSHNGFNGFIPECLTRKNSTLKVLNLAGNRLTGYISDSISSSCSLRFLDLHGNLLSGTIPRSLANCQRLELLNLGNNLLNDRFPCFLRNISTLRVLILRSNKLRGSIRCPRSNGNWEMLHIVDLASNDFTGTLPRSLLQSWTAMMGSEYNAREKHGTLSFDIFDNHDSIHRKDLLPLFGKALVRILLKITAEEPPSVANNIFYYYVNVEDEIGIRYLDSVTVVNKGSQMNFIKILTVFTFLDLSSNHFEGAIPEEIMHFRALNNLNMSYNAFSSHIPSSLGNLTQLESLDLSHNSLNGEIPAELASLSFLSVLNLSYNHLVGKIPTGTQIQSFEADSFKGNEGLCGPPLTKNCWDDGVQGLSPSSLPTSKTLHSIDWNFLSAELGFTFGLGLVILPIIFCKSWRLWYSNHVDELLHRIVPQLDFVYEYQGGQKYRTLQWRPY